MVALDYSRWLAAPRALRVLLLGIALALVGVETLLPGHDGPALDPNLQVYVSNLGHFVLYGLLAVGAALAFRVRLPGRPLALLLIVLAAGLVGWLDEWHQSTQPGRDASLWDLGSDLLGAGLALTAATWSTAAGGLRARLLPLAGLVAVALAWTLLPTFGPPLAPPTP